MAPWMQRVVFRLRALFDRRAVEREIDDELRFHLDMEHPRASGGVWTPRPPALRQRGCSAASRARRTSSATRAAERHREHPEGRALRRPRAATQSRLHLRRGPHARARHRREYRALQRRERRPAPAAAIRRARTPRRDSQHVGRATATPLDGRRIDLAGRVLRLSRSNDGVRVVRRLHAATLSLTGDGEPERLCVRAVSAAVFHALGVVPRARTRVLAGRDVPGVTSPCSATDSGSAASPARATSLAADHVDGDATTVVGVMPDGFRLPEQLSDPDPAELFVPFGLSRDSVTIRGSHFLSGVARLRRGVTPAQGSADVAAVARRFPIDFPSDYPAKMNFAAGALPLLDSVVGQVRPTLIVLLGAVGFVLLIACANVASLLLSRTRGATARDGGPHRARRRPRAAVAPAARRERRAGADAAASRRRARECRHAAARRAATAEHSAARRHRRRRARARCSRSRRRRSSASCSACCPRCRRRDSTCSPCCAKAVAATRSGGRQGARRALVDRRGGALRWCCWSGRGSSRAASCELHVGRSRLSRRSRAHGSDRPSDARYPDAGRVITFYHELSRRVGRCPA